MADRVLHITRDAVLVGFVIVAATYEIVWGGARPAVLTFLTGILLSPLVMRVDERARSRNGNGNGHHYARAEA